MAESQGIERREPDFERLERMLYEGSWKRGFLPPGDRSKKLPYRRLGRAIKRSVTIVYNIVEKKSRPQIDVLVALADAFDDQREPWLEAGGFDVAALPKDRGFTTAERDVARWWNALSAERRGQIEAEIEEMKRHRPDGP